MKHNLFVDSSQRQNGTPTDFKILLRRPIPRSKKVYLYDVAIPFTYYVINSTNNVFQFVYDNFGPIIANFTLAPGNYDNTTIITAIQALLDILVGAGNVVISIDAATSKFVLTATAGTVEIRTADIAIITMQEILGFTTAQVAAASLTADNVYNLSGPNRLYIHSDALQSGSTLKTKGLLNESASYSPVIGSVIVDVNSGGTIRSLIPNPSLDMNCRDIAEIDFSLRYSDGTIVDLNGSNWTLQLHFETN